MPKKENTELNVEMQIREIELLNSSFHSPANPNTPVTDFNFNIHIESRADIKNKLVFVILHVEIRNNDHSVVLGTLSVNCIFEIINFNEVMKIESNGKVNIPHKVIEILNSISISTTRGIMFSTFKGTFLHGAILPIVDPKQFKDNS